MCMRSKMRYFWEADSLNKRGSTRDVNLRPLIQLCNECDVLEHPVAPCLMPHITPVQCTKHTRAHTLLPRYPSADYTLPHTNSRTCSAAHSQAYCDASRVMANTPTGCTSPKHKKPMHAAYAGVHVRACACRTTRTRAHAHACAHMHECTLHLGLWL